MSSSKSEEKCICDHNVFECNSKKHTCVCNHRFHMKCRASIHKCSCGDEYLICIASIHSCCCPSDYLCYSTKHLCICSYNSESCESLEHECICNNYPNEYDGECVPCLSTEHMCICDSIRPCKVYAHFTIATECRSKIERYLPDCLVKNIILKY